MNSRQVEGILHSTIPFVKKNGIKVVKAEPGDVRLKSPNERSNQNQYGTMQAGAIFTLAEITGGVALLIYPQLSDYVLLARTATITFHRPIESDAEARAAFTDEDAFEIEHKVESEGRTVAKIKVGVFNDDSEKAAELEVEFHLSKKRKRS
ncbi:MAG TPA: YiiD C-terminal domain-containing protein [bacterium]|mgnify:CR=1 FL=1|nr:YiiD C-terminal domain-containing protein [bacterium]